METYKIYLVEDDATIARLMAEALESWGYTVCCAQDFTAVLQECRTFAPHLLLLDLSLPHRSGFHWCAEIRKESTIPIVFISSAADGLNMVTALHLGGDDFVAKPFKMTLLVAKVQALLRRCYDFSDTGDQLMQGEVTLDLGGMVLACREARLELTRNEFRIVQVLMEKQGQVVSRSAIMRRLWDNEAFIDDNTLTVNINRLRKKLEAEGVPLCIATRKGEGYQLQECSNEE